MLARQAALTGVLMAPFSLKVVALILAIAIVFMFLIDALKLILYRALPPSTVSAREARGQPQELPPLSGRL